MFPLHFPAPATKSEVLKNYLIQSCHPYTLQVIENLINERIREQLAKNSTSTLIDLTTEPVKTSPDDRKVS